ncbi:BPSS1780 family membrane protein [Chitiniphilus shinanonensis]|uniref:BPSS1780 family membrane protein n=1 Tax=Chitiniphilus shinanonensis TaxID=553088 RepID=UPI000A06A1FA|nr:BPSS1780 family membrane protein [Chitiniphilus shinanonensis]
MARLFFARRQRHRHPATERNTRLLVRRGVRPYDTRDFQSVEQTMQQSDVVIDTTPEPRRVDALGGWKWIVDAFALYRRGWLQWTAMSGLFCVLLMALSVLPLVSMAATILTPVLVAGMMEAADRCRRGEPFAVMDLFNGFRHNTRELVLVGVFYLLAWLVFVMLLVVIITAFGLAPQLAALSEAGLAAKAAQAESVPRELMLFGLFGFFGGLLVSSIYLFAPALVMLRGMRAIEAMKLSYVAFWRNFLPVLVFSVVFIALTIIASIPALLGFIVLIPLALLTPYAAYVGIFE